MMENNPWVMDARTLRQRLVSALGQSAERAWNAETINTIANLHEALQASRDWNASAPAPNLTADGARPINENQSIGIDIGCRTLCTTPERVPRVPLAVAARVLPPGRLMELLERELTRACEDAAWEWARILMNATAQYALIERGTDQGEAPEITEQQIRLLPAEANRRFGAEAEAARRGAADQRRGRYLLHHAPRLDRDDKRPEATTGTFREAMREDDWARALRIVDYHEDEDDGPELRIPAPQRNADGMLIAKTGTETEENRVAVHIALPWRPETETAARTTAIVPLEKGAPLIRPTELNHALAEELKRTLRAGEEQMARECLAAMKLWMPLGNDQPAAKLEPEAFDLGPQAAGTYEAARLRAMRLATNETAQGRFLAARRQTIDLPAAADAA